MSRCASHYQISQLIFWVFQESGLKRSHFAAGLGYRNITGGLRSLDAWLQTGTGDPLLIERLVQSYEVDLLEAAGEGTKMADHLSPSFRPAFPSSADIRRLWIGKSTRQP